MAVKTRLKKDELRELRQNLGTVRLCLLYKGSVHGFHSEEFHSKCENQGPTIVVAYNKSGYIYGGFSSKGFESGWHCSVRDEKAFLYRLNEWNRFTKTSYVKYPVRKPESAILSDPETGPNFGNGALVFLSNRPVQKAKYDTTPAVKTTNTENYSFSPCNLHGNDLSLVEFEAFRVEDIGNTMDFPWRNISWETEEKTRLMTFIKLYKPAARNVPQIRALMVGPVGAGKSSFFNSLNSVFRGHVLLQAEAGSDSTSVTTNYRTYSVKDGKCGKPLPIKLCDTMGLEESPETGLNMEDLEKILLGRVPDRYQFNPGASIEANAPGYIKSPSLKDKIHVVVFLLDASKVGILSETLTEKLKQLRAKCKKYGVPQLVLLTKVDELCPAVYEDVRNAYTSIDVLTQIQRVASLLGIPIANVLPVKNYSHELELEECTDILILHVVQQITRMADAYFEDLDLEEEEEELLPLAFNKKLMIDRLAYERAFKK